MAVQSLEGLILGEYTIGKCIGEGGMGSVYHATRSGDPTDFAIKVMLPEYIQDEEFRRRFKREGALLSQLQHPNIIPVFNYGDENGYLYYVMRMVKGVSLYDLMQKRRFSPISAWQILNPVAKALDYAHSRNVIHRDIKPGNILIEVVKDGQGTKNQIYLADFGLSKVLDWTKLTQTGISVGTPEYMSPEQVMDHPLTPASDVYSLCVVTFEMLLGRYPFHDKRADRIALKHVSEKPPAPSSLHWSFPRALETVLLQGLEKSPEKRFASANEFSVAYANAVRSLTPEEREGDYYVGKPS